MTSNLESARQHPLFIETIVYAAAGQPGYTCVYSGEKRVDISAIQVQSSTFNVQYPPVPVTSKAPNVDKEPVYETPEKNGRSVDFCYLNCIHTIGGLEERDELPGSSNQGRKMEE